MKNNISFNLLMCMLAACSAQATFLAQGSFSLQVDDSIARISGYNVNYSQTAKSPYDVSFGYLFSFRDVVVVPVMLEGKFTTLESYFNTEDMQAEDFENIICDQGHRLDDCEWMSHSDGRINMQKIEL